MIARGRPKKILRSRLNRIQIFGTKAAALADLVLKLADRAANSQVYASNVNFVNLFHAAIIASRT